MLHGDFDDSDIVVKISLFEVKNQWTTNRKFSIFEISANEYHGRFCYLSVYAATGYMIDNVVHAVYVIFDAIYL